MQAPPTSPTAPAFSLVSVLIPAAGTLLMVGVMLLAFSGGYGLFYLISMPIMLLSYLAGYITYRQARRRHRQQLAQREWAYRNYLAELHQTLLTMKEDQQRASLMPNPAPAECLARAERRDRRLWERSPEDNDFLDSRLGTGEAAPTFGVGIPSAAGPVLQPDPLLHEAMALVTRFSVVEESAITLPLRSVGIAGIAGPRYLVQEATRCLLVQLATHHAPSDVKMVLVFPESEMAEWAWARWLPHVWSDDHNRRFVAATPASAHQILLGVGDSLRQRQVQRQARNSGSLSVTPLPAYVFVLADPKLHSHPEVSSLGPLLQLLLTEGPALGAFTLLTADRPERLAKECAATIDLTGSSGSLQIVGPPPVTINFVPDVCSPAMAESLARSLAPVRLQRSEGKADLSNVVTLLDLLGVGFVQELPVADAWRKSQPYRSLAVPIGVRAGGEILELDLHERGHGPHGLMAGATGSGKSELLQSFIASLAMHFHPHEVAVLLIDYKGGGMANVFRDLPHQIGIITNLSGNQATRALAALRSEYQRRQRLFDQVGVNHIDDYQRLCRQGKASEPLPRLVIIADEFAELIQNQPDFMAELVSGVRVGRSLGVHLILATQKPAGVVNDQIWGNTRFRLCLRVEQPEDSREVLKRDDAAAIRRPGRAYFQVGMNEVFELFQAAWGGAPYNPHAGRAAVGQRDITEVELDGTRRRIWPVFEDKCSVQTDETQLQALVGYLHDVAEEEEIVRLPGPWLPPLPEMVVLSGLRESAGGWDGRTWQPNPEWLAPVVGLVDNPTQQSQTPLRLALSREGHLAIFGAPGSGKTTLLQTIITSLALDHSPDEVTIYLVDFGGRLLKQFETLPHVGGVMLPEELERLQRLILMVLREMETRKELLSKAGVGTLAAYRGQVTDPPPAIVLVFDNYVEFRNVHEDLDELVARIAREGGNLGIHLVLTASTVNMSYRLSSNIGLAVALELNDPSDYPSVVGRTGGLVPAPGVRGRGLVRAQPPLEFQTAVPASGATEAERSVTLKDLMRVMADAWQGSRPRPVEVLPEEIPLSQLLSPTNVWDMPAASPLMVPLGLDAESLAPAQINLEDGPHFLITGPPASGKTTLLRTWLLALAERFSPDRVRFHLLGLGDQTLMPLRPMPHVTAYVEDQNQMVEALGQIGAALEERRDALAKARRAAGGILDEQAFLASYPALVVAADDLDQFMVYAGARGQELLIDLIQRSRSLGLYLLVAGPTRVFSSSYEPLIKALKEGQTGLLVGSGDHDDLSIFNIYSVRLPMGKWGKTLVPGRGFFLRRGAARPLHTATCHAGEPSLTEWVSRIVQKHNAGAAPPAHSEQHPSPRPA